MVLGEFVIIEEGAERSSTISAKAGTQGTYKK